MEFSPSSLPERLPMKKTKNKSLDCVELKNRIQKKIYQEIKNLTHDEEIAYYRKSAKDGPLSGWWRRVTEKKKTIRKILASKGR